MVAEPTRVYVGQPATAPPEEALDAVRSQLLAWLFRVADDALVAAMDRGTGVPFHPTG